MGSAFGEQNQIFLDGVLVPSHYYAFSWNLWRLSWQNFIGGYKFLKVQEQERHSYRFDWTLKVQAAFFSFFF